MSTNISKLPDTNFGMIKAAIKALDKVRESGLATQDNGDANLVHAIYEAMKAEYESQQLLTQN